MIRGLATARTATPPRLLRYDVIVIAAEHAGPLRMASTG